MDNENIKAELRGRLREYVESVTTKSKSGKYVCPLCHSGEGVHGTGAFSIAEAGDTWKCFSCNKGGDIFDLYGLIHDTDSYTEQLKGLAGEMGYKLNTGSYTRTEAVKPAPRAPQPEVKAMAAAPEQDYTSFFLEAHRNISQTDYPARRGLSPETLDKFNIGFVPDWKNPKSPTAPGTPRLIIPTSSGSYFARDTRSPAELPEAQKRYSKQNVGGTHIFNAEALKTAVQPVFVVEGAIDALSIIEVGGEAVGLGGTSMVKTLLEKLNDLKGKGELTQQPLIIAADNDEPGRKAASELESGLVEQGITFYRLNPAGEHKDVNEALQADKDEFIKAIAEAEKSPEAAQQKILAEDYKNRNSAGRYLDQFMDGIMDSADTREIPTGFPALDEALDGGLYEGLYIVGAISSLGKTTLVTQITDQIAERGHDVLVFSLEMARTELMAKSISRETFTICQAEGKDTRLAKSARGITNGRRWNNYSEAEGKLITDAMLKYEKYAERVFIREGIGNIGVQQIRTAVAEHIRCTGNKPVIVVDYLQIIAPADVRATDKQNMDLAVLELKRISRDYKIPVIGISSFSRAYYKGVVTMESFKESGAIEYSSDVLIGLQLAGAGASDFDPTEAKRADPREIELVILKNRNGAIPEPIEFEFHPMFNKFIEA